jgi:predicted Zn finger-like uncharacterized protein
MRLVCPNCASSYAIADDALGENGRRVRCVTCKHVWLATSVAAAAMAEPANAAPADGDAYFAEAPAEADMAVEAEPQTGIEPPALVDDAPSIAPDEGPVRKTSAGGARFDYFELRRQRAIRAIARRRQGFKATIGHVSAAMFGIIVALVFARESIVRLLPQTASLYALAGFHINLRGLVFDDMKTAYEIQDGVRVMTVEGQIRNVTNETRPVGRLRFALRNEAGGNIYTWTAMPERAAIKPGEVQRFKTRLATPPPDGTSLSVRFFQARDLATLETVAHGAPPPAPPGAAGQ